VLPPAVRAFDLRTVRGVALMGTWEQAQAKVAAAEAACKNPDADWQAAVREALPAMHAFTDELQAVINKMIAEDLALPRRRHWWNRRTR
jgi:hypothetical protein